MRYLFRTGPFQRDEDAIELIGCKSVKDVVDWVGLVDAKLQYLNHFTSNETTIVRFQSEAYPIMELVKREYYNAYQESINDTH